MNRINRRSLLTSSAAFAASGLLLHKQAHAEPAPMLTQVRSCSRPPTASSPRSTEQRAKATFPFEDDERMNWHFIPKERKGLPLREMSSYQKHLASALLAPGLSQTGYIKAVTIMSLEDVLKTIENDSGERRNPEKYYFTIFGTPSDTGSLGLARGGTSPEPELHGRRMAKWSMARASSAPIPPRCGRARAKACGRWPAKTTWDSR